MTTVELCLPNDIIIFCNINCYFIVLTKLAATEAHIKNETLCRRKIFLFYSSSIPKLGRLHAMNEQYKYFSSVLVGFHYKILYLSAPSQNPVQQYPLYKIVLSFANILHPIS